MVSITHRPLRGSKGRCPSRMHPEQISSVELNANRGLPVVPMCGTFYHFAQPPSGNSVAPLLLLCFLVPILSWMTFYLVALTAFVVYTNDFLEGE